MNPLRISAKNLGAMSLPEFCPRCLWPKPHTKKLPSEAVGVAPNFRAAS